MSLQLALERKLLLENPQLNLLQQSQETLNFLLELDQKALPKGS